MNKNLGTIISKTYFRALSGHLNDFLFQTQTHRGLHD